MLNLIIKIKNAIDKPLLALSFCLLLIGLLALYSASGGNLKLVTKQFIHFVLGVSLMLAIATIPHEDIKDTSPLLYLLCTLMLIAVLGLGFISKGAQRWLGFGSIHIQPSELMKVFLPLCLCWFFNHRETPPKISSLFFGALIALIPFFLVYKQPDLGTAMVLLILAAIAVFLSGIGRQYILMILVFLIGSLPILWQHMHNYQKKRIMIFLNPESDPLGAGYHIMQSKIAVGSGGFWGKGFLNGSQIHLNFLPEHTTDFIFAVIAEEFGFLGCIITIAIIFMITTRIFYLSSIALSGFCKNTCVCMGCLFFISALINMSMVVGLLPVVGIPLPFVSYGGSNMLITCISLGIVMSLKNNWKNHAGTQDN